MDAILLLDRNLKLLRHNFPFAMNVRTPSGHTLWQRPHVVCLHGRSVPTLSILGPAPQRITPAVSSLHYCLKNRCAILLSVFQTGARVSDGKLYASMNFQISVTVCLNYLIEYSPYSFSLSVEQFYEHRVELGALCI